MLRASLTAVLVAFAALTLGGCNLVMSKIPVFTAADAAGAPPLRPGVWAGAEKDCAFDEHQPATNWPHCAGGSVISADAAFDPSDPKTASPYILASGDPRVMQILVDFGGLDQGKPASGSADGDKKVHIFLGLQPLDHDGAGRITRAELWFIQCGPPPPKSTAAKPADSANGAQFATQHPLPGMTMEGDDCTPSGKAAVRAAARPSRAWDDQRKVIHWVRDGAS